MTGNCHKTWKCNVIFLKKQTNKQTEQAIRQERLKKHYLRLGRRASPAPVDLPAPRSSRCCRWRPVWWREYAEGDKAFVWVQVLLEPLVKRIFGLFLVKENPPSWLHDLLLFPVHHFASSPATRAGESTAALSLSTFKTCLLYTAQWRNLGKKMSTNCFLWPN